MVFLMFGSSADDIARHTVTSARTVTVELTLRYCPGCGKHVAARYAGPAYDDDRRIVMKKVVVNDRRGVYRWRGDLFG